MKKLAVALACWVVALTVFGLVLGGTVIFLQTKVAAVDAEANRAWLAAHWLWLVLSGMILWVIRRREIGFHGRGFHEGVVYAAGIMVGARNGDNLVLRMKVNGGFLPFGQKERSGPRQEGEAG